MERPPSGDFRPEMAINPFAVRNYERRITGRIIAAARWSRRSLVAFHGERRIEKKRKWRITRGSGTIFIAPSRGFTELRNTIGLEGVEIGSPWK